MASRPSPLSLKARAIALLAQREHSVAELRRKLLRLAQLRDLQAWEAAQGASTAVSSPGGPAVHGGLSPSPREVGSFDLAEDWGEGELDAFMERWDAAPAPFDDEAAPVPDLLDAAAAVAAVAARGQAEDPGGLGEAGEGREGGTDRSRQDSLGLAGACAGGRGQRRAGRRSARPALPPSPEARLAVMAEERQQARAEEVEQLLQWLQQRAYLSEARLVESRINARASRYGNLRIQQELRQLGVAPDEEQQARLKDSEFERAREVWQRKFGGETPVDAPSRARQMRFLAARGFSSEVVRRVLRGEDD